MNTCSMINNYISEDRLQTRKQLVIQEYKDDMFATRGDLCITTIFTRECKYDRVARSRGWVRRKVRKVWNLD
jgi:hypothetical protein